MPVLGFYINASAHTLYRFAHDCQTHACSVVTGLGMRALKRLEYLGLRISWNADAIVLNVKPDRRAAFFRPDADFRRRAGGNEFHRIGQQIGNALHQRGV